MEVNPPLNDLFKVFFILMTTSLPLATSEGQMQTDRTYPTCACVCVCGCCRDCDCYVSSSC